MTRYDLILATTPLETITTLAASNHLTEEGIIISIDSTEDSDPSEPIEKDQHIIIRTDSNDINKLASLITNVLKANNINPTKPAIAIDNLQSDPVITAAMTQVATNLNQRVHYLNSKNLDTSNLDTEKLLLLAGIDLCNIVVNKTNYNKKRLDIAKEILDNQYNNRFKEEWDCYWNAKSDARELINRLNAVLNSDTRNFATRGWLKELATYQLQLLKEAHPKKIKELTFLKDAYPQIDAIILKQPNNQIITLSFILKDWQFEDLREICETGRLMGQNTQTVIFANFGSGQVIEGLEMLLYSKGLPNANLWSLESIKDIQVSAEFWLDNDSQ